MGKLENFVIKLIQNKIIEPSTKEDVIVRQYKDLVDKIRAEKRREVFAFKPSADSGVDVFFSDLNET